MARIAGYFEYDDDLTPGRSKDGGIHHNLYDHGRLSGHGKFVLGDESDNSGDDSYVTDGQDEEITNAELAATVGLLAGIIVWERSKPHVKEWWDKRGRQGLKSRWEGIAGGVGPSRQADVSEHSTVVEESSVVPSKDMEAENSEDSITLTRAQAQTLFGAALKARNFSDATFELLRKARIVDADGNFNPAGELEKITRHKIGNAVQQVLSMKFSTSEETPVEIRVVLERIWGGTRRF